MTAPDDLDPPAFRAFLRSLDGPPGETLEQTRARLDRRGLAIPLPEGCSVAPMDAGGVAAEGLTPASARDGRLLIYLHGGGYQVCSPRSNRHFAARLAQAAAVAAIVPDYRLTPEHPFPAAVEDALAVYRWALDRLDPQRIAVAGDSAGGGLSMALAVAARDAGLPLPGAIHLISPWLDMTASGASYAAKAESDIFCTLDGLRRLRADYLAGADPREPRASPVFADLSGMPPLLIQVGSEEILLSDSVSLAERAALARVEVRLDVFADMLHGFPLFHPQLSAARRAIGEAGDWIRDRLA